MTGSVLIFVASLALSVVSSIVLVRFVSLAGNRFALSESLFGIVAALAANSPEIAAAVTAVQSGRQEVGVGVVLGSNLFNVAALLGVSAVVANGVRIHRGALALNGGVALVVTGLGAGLVLHLLAAATSVLLVLLVFVPYVAVLWLAPRQQDDDREPSGRIRRYLSSAVAEQEKEIRPSQQPRMATNSDLLALVPILVAVVFGSVELVHSAVNIGGRLGVGQSIIGALILGPLTGIPNVITAVSLARHGRGAAVVSESLNSNTLNVLVGLCLPAVLLGTSAVTGAVTLEAFWLLGLSAFAVALTGFRGGLLRLDGVLVLLGYLGFVLVSTVS